MCCVIRVGPLTSNVLISPYLLSSAQTGLRYLQSTLKDVPCVGLTATPAQGDPQKMAALLGLRRNYYLNLSPLYRKNLHLEVTTRSELGELHDEDLRVDDHRALARLLASRPSNTLALIVVPRRTLAENLATALRTGTTITDDSDAITVFRAQHFHSGVQLAERNIRALDFQRGNCEILVTTKGYGEGVDHTVPPISLIVHFAQITSIFDYVQQIGRGGRDGSVCRCIAMLNSKDMRDVAWLTESVTDVDHARHVHDAFHRLQAFVRSSRCRWFEIGQVFVQQAFSGGAEAPYVEHCGHCDNCQIETEEVDVTVEAAAIVLAVSEAKQTAKPTQIAGILIGSNAQGQLSQWRDFESFGLLRSSRMTRKMIEHLLIQLIDQRTLEYASTSGSTKRHDSVAASVTMQTKFLEAPVVRLAPGEKCTLKRPSPTTMVPLKVFRGLGFREKPSPELDASRQPSAASSGDTDNPRSHDPIPSDISTAPQANARPPRAESTDGGTDAVTKEPPKHRPLDPNEYRQEGPVPPDLRVDLEDAEAYRAALQGDGLSNVLFSMQLNVSLSREESPWDVLRTDRLKDEILISRKAVDGAFYAGNGGVLYSKAGLSEYLTFYHADHDLVRWLIKSTTCGDAATTHAKLMSTGKGLRIRWYCAHSPVCTVTKNWASNGWRGGDLVFKESHGRSESSVHTHTRGQSHGAARGVRQASQLSQCDNTALPDQHQLALSNNAPTVTRAQPVRVYMHHNSHLAQSNPTAFGAGIGVMTAGTAKHDAEQARREDRPWLQSNLAALSLKAAKELRGAADASTTSSWQTQLDIAKARTKLLHDYLTTQAINRAREGGTYGARSAVGEAFEPFLTVESPDQLVVIVTDVTWKKVR